MNCIFTENLFEELMWFVVCSDVFMMPRKRQALVEFEVRERFVSRNV